MKKRKAHLIIHPREGRNVARLSEILAVLAAGGYETTVALKEYGGHTQELARRAAEEKADLIISYGGDGTLNHVVNGVMQVGSQAIVGMIPGGTANLWAVEIGIPADDPVKAALALLDSETRLVDVGHVTVESVTLPDAAPIGGKGQQKATARSHFLLMAGLGLDAMVMQGVSKPLKHKIKQFAVGLSAARELPTYRPFPLEVRDASHTLLWQGEAIQVILGNTRLYGDIFHMTPDAYIDDGQLDVCVITSGDFAGTVQQIFSLLLHRQPANVTAEYFRDARLFLKAPAPVALQFDGSVIKLKDLLSVAQKKALKTAANPEEIMIEYAFEALPRPLRVAIPRAYDDTLFEENRLASAEPSEQENASAAEKQSSEEVREERLPDLLAKLREQGRSVSVVAARRDLQSGAYIVAGKYIQASTGAAKPAAIRINSATVVLNERGARLSPSAAQKLGEGREVRVLGKKSKRGVIQAEAVLL